MYNFICEGVTDATSAALQSIYYFHKLTHCDKQWQPSIKCHKLVYDRAFDLLGQWYENEIIFQFTHYNNNNNVLLIVN
jgi:hypothetical protein